MLDKFKNMTESIKSTIDNMNSGQKETGDSETKKDYFVSIGLGDSADSETKEKKGSFTAKLTEKVTSAKDSLKDFSIIGKIKDFSSNAVNMVAELDEYLTETNSAYEVGDFRVSANIGVVAGMSLDIRFIKTQTAKSISHEMSKLLTVINPNTGKDFRIPRLSLAGKSQAKVRDPNTNEIFLIDVKTGEVISLISTKSEQPKIKTQNQNTENRHDTVNKSEHMPQDEYLFVINPKTGNKIKIMRNKLKGRDTAKIKDPATGDLLIFDTKTGKIISERMTT